MSMKIGDLLHLAGPRKMSEFPWGTTLVEGFNERLAGHLPAGVEVLTVEVSAEEARETLLNLPTDALVILLSSEFDMVAMKITIPTPVEKLIEKIDALPVPEPPPPAPKPAEQIEDRKSKVRSAIALMFGGTLCAIALAIAVAMSASTVKTGEMPDSSALKSVVELMGEVLKAYNKPAEPPAEPKE